MRNVIINSDYTIKQQGGPIKLSLIFAGLLAASLPVSAAMYKCTDAEGNIAFMDKPCQTQKQEVLKQKSDKPTFNSPKTQVGAPSKIETDTDRKKSTNCADKYYLKVTKELDKAYQEQGRPKPDFNIFAKVLNLALSRLKAQDERPELRKNQQTYSLSAMSTYIFIDIRCDGGKGKEGEWRP